jgi:hypothetical protein
VIVGLTSVAALASGCAPTASRPPCLVVPAADTTPPSAHLVVEYRTPGGERTTLGVDPGSPNVTIEADVRDRIVTIYSGSDDQGVRSISLQYDQRVTEGRTQVQPLISPFKVTTECPLSHLLSSRVFEPSGRPWRYAFVAVAHNWKGDSTKSGILRVVTR